MATTGERLRAAALELFAEHGFRETTIGSIEAAAGLAPRAGSFYRHYASKEEVFSDCVATFVAETFEELTLSEFLPLGNIRAELLIIGQTLLKLGKKHRKIRTLVRNEATRRPEVAAKAGEINDRFKKDTLMPWLRTTLAPTKPKAKELESLAYFIFAPILHYMTEQDRNQRAFGLEQTGMLSAWADFWAAELERRIA